MSVFNTLFRLPLLGLAENSTALITNCYTIMSWIPNLPLTYRDAIVTFSRIQSDYSVRCMESFRTLDPPFVKFDNDCITPDILYEYLTTLLASPTTLSLLSALARQEAISPEYLFEVQERIDAAILKEMSASALGDKVQQLNYNGLFENDETINLTPGWSSPDLFRKFSRALSRFKTKYENTTYPIYPKYQKKKNIGYSTQELLARRWGLTYPGELDLTSLSLETYYHVTGGDTIGGPMEVRFSWRPSQTKPRVYYSNGGTSYFFGRFIRQLVNDLVDSFPATNRHARFDIERIIQFPLQSGEIILTYDYSSFTTTLSELKYFVHYLARELRGLTIMVVDTAHGLQFIDAGQLLEDYNNAINVNAEFDVHRIDGLADLAHYYMQTRSGMLGCQGNIGLSTLLHGLHAQAICDKQAISVVGDDALLRVWYSQLKQVLQSVQLLCNGIPEEKTFQWLFEATNFYTDQPDGQVIQDTYQYLKRPLQVDVSGQIHQGVLPDFPNLGALVGVSYVGDTPSDKFQRSKTFLMQMTRFITKLRVLHEIELSDSERDLFLAIFKCAYRYMGVPFHGGLPGEIKIHGQVLYAMVPPLSDDIFVVGWESAFSTMYAGKSITMGKYVAGNAHAGYCFGVGEVIECILHAPQRLMRDLDYFEVEPIRETYIVDENFSEFIESVLNGTLRSLYRVICVREVPKWYNDLMFYDIDSRYSVEAGWSEIYDHTFCI